eukprot:COSAG05_NODE_7601_length_791_cov_1.241329_1_plen_226_part_10
MAEPEPEGTPEPLTPAKQTGKGATTEQQRTGSSSGRHNDPEVRGSYNRKDLIPPPQKVNLRKRIEKFRIDYAEAYDGKEDTCSDENYHAFVAECFPDSLNTKRITITRLAELMTDSLPTGAVSVSSSTLRNILHYGTTTKGDETGVSKKMCDDIAKYLNWHEAEMERTAAAAAAAARLHRCQELGEAAKQRKAEAEKAKARAIQSAQVATRFIVAYADKLVTMTAD